MNYRRSELVTLGVLVTLALVLAAVWPADRATAAPDEADAATNGAAEAEASKQPWIGLRITPVPDALAAHLELGEGRGGRLGLMVRNVVTGGPADRAGLKRFDVIVGLGEAEVTSAMGRFVRQISRLEPGQAVAISIIRAGKPTQLKLTVGDSAPDAGADYRYKYPQAPSGVMQEQRRFEGAVITRGPDGWQWEDFKQANAAALGELPPEMVERLREFAALTTRTGPSERTVIQHGDRTVEILRGEGGRITVRTHRHDDAQNSDALVQTYASAAAFRDADPRAFELQARLANEPLLPPDAGDGAGEAAAGATDPAGEGAAAADGGEVDTYEAQRRQYEAFLEGYLEYLRERMNDPEAEGQGPPPMMWRELLEQTPDRANLPEREFTRHASGRIDVRIRKPSGDLVLSFRNAQAMKEEDADLYQHYRALVDDE